MTNGRESDAKRHFVLTWLPWILGLAALGLYLVTLNRSLSFLPDWLSMLGSAPAAVRMAGWSFQPDQFTPAYYLVTYPIRWLPPSSVPLAINLFSALCAAAALTQLAGLPTDRTVPLAAVHAGRGYTVPARLADPQSWVEYGKQSLSLLFRGNALAMMPFDVKIR